MPGRSSTISIHRPLTDTKRTGQIEGEVSLLGNGVILGTRRRKQMTLHVGEPQLQFEIQDRRIEQAVRHLHTYVAEQRNLSVHLHGAESVLWPPTITKHA